MYGNHRRIVTYKIFINKQKHKDVTIRLALYIYIYINVTVQSNLGSSRAMLRAIIIIIIKNVKIRVTLS